MVNDTDDTDEMVEVFRAVDRMGAQAAIDEVLQPLGIDGFVHDRMSHALPAPASMPGGYFIAVPVTRASEAVAALRDALTGRPWIPALPAPT